MATVGVTKWKFTAALPLSIACLALGNLFGVILTKIWGWEGVQQGQSLNFILGFIQGCIGSLVAMAVSDHFLKSSDPSDFWVKWIVRLFGALFAVVVVLALYQGQTDLVFDWTALAALTTIIGTEVGRRSYDSF